MNNEWFANTIETPGVPMVDKGIGTAYDLKCFEFAMKPLPPNTAYPTRQQLFDAHWPELRTRIWADGLIANEDVPPRVHIGKSRYRIFILCESRITKHGRQISKKEVKTLQEVFKKVDKK